VVDVTVSLPGPWSLAKAVVIVPLDGSTLAVVPVVIEKLELTALNVVPSAAKQV